MVSMLHMARRLRGVSNFCIALWAIIIAEFQSVKHRYNWSTIVTNDTSKITTKYMTDKLVNIDLVEIGSSSVALDWTWSISYLQAAKVMVSRGHIAAQSCIIKLNSRSLAARVRSDRFSGLCRAHSRHQHTLCPKTSTSNFYLVYQKTSKSVYIWACIYSRNKTWMFCVTQYAREMTKIYSYFNQWHL